MTAFRMFQSDDEAVDLERNWVVRGVRKFMPITDDYRGTRFTVVENGIRLLTPLMLVLLVVETSDVIFALDSIPAVFGITTDPFIVYTSNVFAILGLWSLYFLLAGVVDKFHYLKTGLAIILALVGAKMVTEVASEYLMAEPIHVPIQWSLAVIFAILGGSIALSLLFPQPEPALAVVTAEPAAEGIIAAKE